MNGQTALTSLNSLVLFAGISGAGRSTAIDAAADLGYYTVENLPVSLLDSLLANVPARVTNVALSLDLDSDEKLAALDHQLQTLGFPGDKLAICFLDCDYPTVIRRYSQTRRPHPRFDPLLDATLEDTVAREKEQLYPLLERSDLLIDSSGLSPHELRIKVIEFLEQFKISPVGQVRINFVSFGYKFGTPYDCDLVLDLRFINNPYFKEELREKTGLDQEIQDFLWNEPSFVSTVDRYSDLIMELLPLYIASGKRYLNVAIGCTGGRHRSVAAVEAILANITKMLASKSYLVSRKHRDILLK